MVRVVIVSVHHSLVIIYDRPHQVDIAVVLYSVAVGVHGILLEALYVFDVEDAVGS